MPLYDLKCSKCSSVFRRAELPSDGIEEWRGECPNCLAPEVRRIWLKAPSMRMGGYTREVQNLQQACRDHFHKKELDEVRHKHGSAIDDSLKGAAVEKIKTEKGIL